MRVYGAIISMLVSVGCSGSEDARANNGNVPPSTDVTMVEIKVRDLVFDARAAGQANGEVFLLHGFSETWDASRSA